MSVLRRSIVKIANWRIALIVLAILGVSHAGIRTGTHLRRATHHVPAFQATSLQGSTVNVSPGHRGRNLLVFFCMCSNCFQFAKDLRGLTSRRAGAKPQLIGVIHAPLRPAVSFAEMTRFSGVLLIDPKGDIHRKFKVRQCPNVWLINPGGTVQFVTPERARPHLLRQRLDAWLNEQ
jgi:peroxiredoxin